MPTNREYETTEAKLALENSSEPHWAPWKVTVSILLFCGAFWVGGYYLLAYLFS